MDSGVTNKKSDDMFRSLLPQGRYDPFRTDMLDALYRILGSSGFSRDSSYDAARDLTLFIARRYRQVIKYEKDASWRAYVAARLSETVEKYKTFSLRMRKDPPEGLPPHLQRVEKDAIIAAAILSRMDTAGFPGVDMELREFAQRYKIPTESRSEMQKGIAKLYMKKVHDFPVSHFASSSMVFMVITMFVVSVFALLLVASLRAPPLGRVTLPLLALSAVLASNAWLALGALSGTLWNPLQSLLLLDALAVFGLALAVCRQAGDPAAVGPPVRLSPPP